ncbi:thiamine phosphate synthase [Haloferula sp. A504]|uniref:thiamine phosphate synthase n=1 Tax=Haloferula sp. A504 TaxID=3373601 RepID=UPI0031BC0BB3|nr:thiamine phosphate synthase [Verrucomicrobiaceae bacterium E54]
MSRDLSDARLYAIVDLGYTAAADLEEVARALIGGGADIVQLRAKGHEAGDIESMARRLLPVCREAGVPFIINDHPQIARRIGADGVHLGQDDGSLAEARAVVGADAIVGRSTHSPGQAAAAVAEGFDYIGFGPLFPTPTKLGRPGIGLDDIAAVRQDLACRLPVFCIGGIRRANLPDVLAAGARRVVIVSDLLSAPDITAATAQARELLGGD